ncbi:MAG: OsmC family protein [Planctomycetota bacterium]
MVEIEAVYEGNLHCRARHAPSAAELTTDAPKDNEGLGASFSPTDLLATALGTCMMTIMGIVARRHQWSLDGARVRVEKHMHAAPRRVGRLVVAFHLPAQLPVEARARIEQAAFTCPVHASLHPDIEIPVEFIYDG